MDPQYGANGNPPPIGFEMHTMPDNEPNLAPPPPVGFEGLNNNVPEPSERDGLYPNIDNQEANANDVHVNLEADKQDDREPLTGQDEMNGGEDPTQRRMRGSESMFLADGKQRIDYILAYCDDCVPEVDTEGSPSKDKAKKAQQLADRRGKRQYFEDGLREQGLLLETEDKKESQDGKTYFVKIHAPWDVLARHAELMNIKMPMKEGITGEENDIIQEEQENCCSKLPRIPHPFRLSDEIVKPEPNYFTTYFNRERLDMFIMKDKDTFFTNAQRSRMVHEILQRTRYDDSKSKIGLKRLVNQGIYTAAYPLHEGEYTSDHSILTHGAENDRHLLYEVWARPGMWYKYQPADLIRKYFGEKIAIYFAWLGFYTAYLLPAALIGLAVTLYGVFTMFDHIPSNDICNKTGVGDYVMCPLCDQRCNYWKLGNSCLYSRVSYVFDNPGTVFFAVFMSLWATMFLEFWKRRQAAIQYDWDVADFEEEEETIRPEFESKVRTTRLNPVTQILEPYMPFYSRLPRITSSFLVIVFMICLVLAAVFAVILYRTIMVTLLYASGDDFLKTNAKIATTVTAGLLNLIIIMVLNKLYEKLAIMLTNFENPKTDTEFDDKFTFKMFMFQFCNYYSSIFYVAFFKGNFVGRPGDYDYRLFRRQEECDPAGCLIELCIQLAIVMIGKQTFNNFKEIGIPMLKNCYRRRIAKKQEEEAKNVYTRWERDYDLETMPPLGLFDEYLEMVIQYGFITIFVAAFPLAPLFALINNIIEVRLDAFKYVTQYRRPMAMRAQDIGVWFNILKGISRLAILTNALIIATTSKFIPKLVYLYAYSPDGTMKGYMADSLSRFEISNFQNQSVPENPGPEYKNLKECYYQAYRHPPGDKNEYEFTMQYWHTFAARIIFVLVFEHVVVISTWLIDMLVPDMPGEVKEQMLREKYLAKEALYSAETLRQRKVPGRSPRPSPRHSAKDK